MISVVVDGGSVIARLDGVDEAVKKRVRAIVGGSLQNIRTSAAKRVRVDTGRLKKNIHIVMDDDGLGGVVTPDESGKMIYAAVNELGRRPGRQPPVDALVPWVRRHHLAQRGHERSVAYLVARAIGRRGVPAQPYLAPSLVEEAPRFKQRLEEALRDI